MKWFKNLKIAKKMILVSVIVSMIAGAVGAVGIYNLMSISKMDKELYENVTLPLSAISAVSGEFERIRPDSRDVILQTTPEGRKKYVDITETRFVTLTKLVTDLKKSITTQKGQETCDSILAAVKVYKTHIDKVVALSNENRNAEAYAMMMAPEMQASADAVRQGIAGLTKMGEASGKETADSNQRAAKDATIMMLAIIAAGMIISIFLGLYLSKVISRPINKLVKVAGKIADGNLDVFVENGDKDELGDLAEAFRRMKDHLNDVLTNINVIAEQVAAGSRQVSDSSIALSQGATEQAGSVEELTASVEEISAQTKHNAENANLANSLSEAAMVNASQGKSQMLGMVKAMEEINESSNNISRIIKVIDDIAFQTNILALNAAVEAARAGQYGRGFAVVAEEVRNLAARSAGAAKETTDMIESSIVKVKAGTKIADETSSALNKIVVDVDKVAGLVKEIATASNEQSIGIEQVNQGLMQVSQVVQTNSATSEESAAASEELSSQAEVLKNNISSFKLHKNTNAPDIEGINEVEKPRDDSENKTPRAEKTGRKKIALTEAEFGKY